MGRAIQVLHISKDSADRFAVGQKVVMRSGMGTWEVISIAHYRHSSQVKLRRVNWLEDTKAGRLTLALLCAACIAVYIYFSYRILTIPDAFWVDFFAQRREDAVAVWGLIHGK
jgi:hypothetical protein